MTFGCHHVANLQQRSCAARLLNFQFQSFEPIESSKSPARYLFQHVSHDIDASPPICICAKTPELSSSVLTRNATLQAPGTVR